MKRTTSRILSVALSATLACSLFGAPALADPGSSSRAEEQGGEAAVADASADAPEAEPDAVEGDLAFEDLLDIPADVPAEGDELGIDEEEAIVYEDEAAPAEGREGVVQPRTPNRMINVTIKDTRQTVYHESTEFEISLDGPTRDTMVVSSTKSERPKTDNIDSSMTGTDDFRYYVALASFQKLEPGTYTVTIKSDKFTTYQQVIELNAGARSIMLYTGSTSVNVDDKISQPGLIYYGDVDRNGSVTRSDALQVIGAIEDREDKAWNNLNGERTAEGADVVNLIDLQILAENLGHDTVLSEAVDTSTPGTPGDTDDVPLPDFAVDENTSIVESADKNAVTPDRIDEIIGNFDPSTVLLMQPTNGEAISQANPVQIDMNNLQNVLSNEETQYDPDTGAVLPPSEPVLVEGVKITSPVASQGAVKGGTLVATYDDNGVERTIEVPFDDEAEGSSSQVTRSLSAGAMAASASSATAETALQTTIPGASGAARAAEQDDDAAATQASAAKSAARSLAAPVQASGVRAASRTIAAPAGSATSAIVAPDGTITINFGKKIAIKRITLKVTKTAASSGELNLAEISSVEFLNDMDQNVGAPEMNIPEGLAVTNGSKQFTLTWEPAPNSRGYEVSIEAKGKQEIRRTTATSLTVTSFVGGTKGKVENGIAYTVKVQSMNGEWRSGWSQSVVARPKATKVPDKPEGVTARGGYRFVALSWKAMEDTDFYNVYYRLKTDANDGAWTKIANIENNSYTLDGLADRTEYQFYVTGQNEIGPSPASDVVSGRTEAVEPAELPNYKAISNDRIVSLGIAAPAQIVDTENNMTTSDWSSVVPVKHILMDGDYRSYVNVTDWDMGVSYHTGAGIIATFDEPLDRLGFISFAAAIDNNSYSGLRVTVTHSDGKIEPVPGASITQKTCENGRRYNIVRLPGNDANTDVKSVRIGLNRYSRGMNIAEMRFHDYDSVYDDIMGVYDDEMHIRLRDDLGLAAGTSAPQDETSEARYNRMKAALDTLQNRLNEKSNGEEFPFKASAQSELDYAKKLLDDEKAGLGDVRRVHASLADAYDSGKNLGISGLNAWQPLGKAIAAGDRIIVYVKAKDSGNTGRSKIDLYVGQQYGESSMPPRRLGTFSNGRTEFTVPADFLSSSEFEKGGRMYVQYTGNNPADDYEVRILGAEDIPMLDLYGVTDEAARDELISDYVAELEDHVGKLEQTHKAMHETENDEHEHASVNYPYEPIRCISNATDIMTDRMMISVHADKALEACGQNLPSATRADHLATSLEGLDQMMDLFYQHKGLMKGAGGTNEVPARHLNIRCMQMFAGAFMYAAGNHIGVGYPESKNFGILVPVETDENGKLTQGQYYGWGSAHEIGHNINDGRYALAEVTNNYFAQICWIIEGQRQGGVDSPAKQRWQDASVYERVTSGAMGRTGNVATQLAMYWQLMLAYDKSPEVYTFYDSADSLLANRFYAKMESYARNPSSAPGTLVLGDRDQNTIRLASAAAGKDLRTFFERWGLEADADTVAYVEQFPAEERAIYYDTNATRKVRGGVPAAESDASSVAVGGFRDASDTESSAPNTVALDGSDVTLTMSTGGNASIHGYEITRNVYAAGKLIGEVVGFVEPTDGVATFTDHAAYLGNICVEYDVRAVTNNLYYSEPQRTHQVKLAGNGLYDSAQWTVSSNMTSPQDIQSILDAMSNNTYDCSGVVDDSGADGYVPAIDHILDGSEVEVPKLAANGSVVVDEKGAIQMEKKGTYRGSATADPQVTIDMGSKRKVEHLEYTQGNAGAAMGAYKVELSENGTDYVEAATGTITGTSPTQIYFPDTTEGGDGYVDTFWARYVRVTMPGQAGKEIGIASLKVYGPSGDNVELTEVKVEGESASIPAIGKLKDDFVYEASTGKKIPAGSIIFTGSYKGNPAYNVFVLYNEKGELLGGADLEGNLQANQIVLADDPGNAELGETADGRWVYWIEPGAAWSAEKVRVEMYRVDNAFTNEGQRLVSDCKFVTVPGDLPDIVLTSDATNPNN